MGKSLDDLGLDDTPLPDPSRQARKEFGDVVNFLEDIRDLLDSGKANWATETLEGISVTVEQTSRVTEGQRKAFEKIRDAAERPRYQRRRW